MKKAIAAVFVRTDRRNRAFPGLAGLRAQRDPPMREASRKLSCTRRASQHPALYLGLSGAGLAVCVPSGSPMILRRSHLYLGLRVDNTPWRRSRVSDTMISFIRIVSDEN